MAEEIILCETCEERGRERPATHEELRMCDACFDGKPTCAAEEAGDPGDEKRRIRQRRYKQLPRNKEKRRLWMQKNRERLNAYRRQYEKECREAAAESRA